MSEGPTGYDHERTTATGARTRQRLDVTIEQGEVLRFVQLEDRLGDGWVVIVWYDHDASGETAHDVTADGLNIDIYRDWEKHATEYTAVPLPAGVALDLAEDHFSRERRTVNQEFRGMASELTDREAGMLKWTSGATLTGFEIVLTADGTDPTTDPGSSSTRTSGQPDFGLLVAMLAISILVLGFTTEHRLL